MVFEESDGSKNKDHRRPRPYGHSEGSDREDLFEEDDNEDDEEDSDDEDIQIPPDPAPEARMAALRQEHSRVMANILSRDQILAQMADRTREIYEAVAERQRELDEVRAAREQREREALEAKANETKTDEKDQQQKDDRDKDLGGNSST